MPALDGYGHKQANPWSWGSPYVAGGTAGQVGVISGPFTTTNGYEFFADREKSKIGFDLVILPGNFLWVRQRRFERLDIPEPDKSEMRAKMVDLGLWPDDE